MRFAGCCNISCKRIDAVEHSDDLGNRYDGEDVSTKNPVTKALARVHSRAVAS